MACMDRIALKAQEREVLGKKVKLLRRDGIVPGHVYGNKLETEHVSVKGVDFLKVLKEAGETGLVDLRIGEEKVRPVLIRGVQLDPRTGDLFHIDFYQVNLKEKVTVPVPIVLIGDEPESVKMGDTVVLQTLNEVQVEALPTDLVENFEVNIEVLKNIGDTILVSQLNYDREKLNVLAESEEVVVKLDTAVTEEMKALLEEQEAEAEAALEAEGEVGETPVVEGEEGAEGVEGQVPAEGGEGEVAVSGEGEEKSQE
ncbi:MAG: 50S ribosomal protein L25 [Candidatus Daviesbacteria bacterium GW2011_GWB1_36_5]|uniref:Large ribosomal subunit protein bL25 n=3 Tax=Candidatus Daviesiibacteriota TaxID=1752718 RepID=A0A0G0EQ97_9BACT|nr:MAG: 50S ribosomal protein L25 [Candidatus Daviesbacteria bacterium GW2011_GWB1_36_5]